MFCASTRPRYQVSVYRTIGPLVINDIVQNINVGLDKIFTINELQLF